ncbi:deoxynucleoside kinase [Candidatus Woesearchaeota archaeon]|nr:deoxynucleoside kinase [Candidatus Woesearchaeota archaeon]
MKRGKLIVLCGTDGSGKTTQTELLIKRLEQEGHPVEIFDFPQYGKTFFADLVQRYLEEEFGTPEQVGPYLASILFAGDRWQAKEEMLKKLEEGKIVVCNRYVSANKGHQGGKIQDKEARLKFLDWLNKLEYEVFGIPKADINVFLYVPSEIGLKLIEQRGREKDAHENLEHMKAAEQAYLEAAEKNHTWQRINCTKEGEILSKEEIHEMVWEKVKEVIE